MDRLRSFWESLTSSLWFVPTIMTAFALALAFGTVSADRAFSGTIPLTYGGGPEGARKVLSVIAGSMITIAGVSFSVIIVALQLASQQFGPRLLRNFMRDTGNQIVLGTFIATFSYCLIVLRTIRGGESEFVPHISVTVAIAFALASLGVLIYFIHHTAVSIQAPELIAMVSNDLHAGIDRIFPDELGQTPGEEEPDEALLRRLEERGRSISATETGYLQSIGNEALMSVATRNDLTIYVKLRPGEFVFEGKELARCYDGERVDDKLAAEIRAEFVLGTQRMHLQDLEFSLQQLVEVAVRSLSPAVNDPFTAVNCIDRIVAALSVLAQKPWPSAFRYDDDRKLRVIAEPVSFAAMVNIAFDSIRHYGRSSALVTMRLLEAIQAIAEHARRCEDRMALLEQAQLIERGSRDAFADGRDRNQIDERFGKAIKMLRL